MNYRSVMASAGPAQSPTPARRRRPAGPGRAHRPRPQRRGPRRRPPRAGRHRRPGPALAEVSAKVRTGPPKDDDPDYDLPIWAGVLPLALTPGGPVPDPVLDPSIPTPRHVATWTRPAPAALDD
jgi:uncharacterized protein